VVRGSGTDKRTYREQIHAEKDTFPGHGTRVRGGEPVIWDLRFQIPEDAPTSFAAKDNELRWSVFLVVDATGAPAWKDDAPFVVRPRRVVAVS